MASTTADPQLAAEEQQRRPTTRDGADADALSALGCELALGVGHRRESVFGRGPVGFARMEGFGGMFGDPEELQRRMAEFAEQLQGQQRLAWADNAIKLAVDMTVAAINRINLQGNAEQQMISPLSLSMGLVL